MKYNLTEVGYYYPFGNVFVFKKSNSYIEDMITNHYYPKVLSMKKNIYNLMNSVLIK